MRFPPLVSMETLAVLRTTPEASMTEKRYTLLVLAGLASLALGCGGDDAVGPTPERPSGPVNATTSTGTIRVITASSGVDLDANGFAVEIDNNGVRYGIDVNDTVSISGVTAGTHSVNLRNKAGNCPLSSGTNPRNVTVSGGVTTTTKFTMVCSTNTTPSGDIQIVTTTTGTNLDPDGYTYTVDSAAIRPIGINATATVVGHRVGTSQVLLMGIAPNCSVTGSNPDTVQITQNATVQAAFAVTCSGSSSTGAIKVTTATTGSNLDPDGYTVAVDGGTGQSIGINASVTFSDLSAGNHSVQLSGVATNCTVGGQNPRTVSVTGGATASTSFAITCGSTTAPGSIRVTTTTTTNGILQDPDGYKVSVDDNGATLQSIGLNASVTFTGLAPGSHTIKLGHFAGNCAVNGANPVTATVTSNTTTQVPMPVTCGSTLKQNQILFLSTRDAGTATNIYVMNQDGSNVMRVTNTSFNDQDVAISPDGNTMVFSRIDQTAHYQVYRMRFDGSAPVKISTNGNVSDSDPEWSPDGSKLAFESDQSGSPEVWFMNPDGSGRVELTNNGGENGDVDWSPDGSMIVFESHINGKSDVYVINTDGTGLTDLTPNTPNSFDTDPNWSPDGTMVTFGSDRAFPGAGTSQGTYQVYVMNANGSNVRRVTNTNIRENAPAWSPDGSQLAFHSRQTSTNFEVFTIAITGANRLRLTNNPAFDGYPEWTRPAPAPLLAARASLSVTRMVAAAAATAPQVPACVAQPGLPGCHKIPVIPDWQAEH